MFTAWWYPFSRNRRDPWRPASRQLHGVRGATARPRGINLLDYGCIRIFPPKFVGGRGRPLSRPAARRRDRIVHAYETWGFKELSRETDRHPQHLGALHLWPAARRPGAHHRRRRRARPNTAAARPSRCTRRCRKKGPVTVPREFVFMDRAAIGLGGVFLHLRAELNFHRLFEARRSSGSRSTSSASARRRRWARSAKLEANLTG